MIVAEHLTKRFGPKQAVSDVSFTVSPGRVTGFLGPNGAGKSTTMRMIVGLDRPTAGRVTIHGREYRTLRSPLTEVGVLEGGQGRLQTTLPDVAPRADDVTPDLDAHDRSTLAMTGLFPHPE